MPLTKIRVVLLQDPIPCTALYLQSQGIIFFCKQIVRQPGRKTESRTGGLRKAGSPLQTTSTRK